tara:strand:+ start:3026 stop:4513 length:1488 start_codon:yes stop_codon:yes gene_type:complete
MKPSVWHQHATHVMRSSILTFLVVAFSTTLIGQNQHLTYGTGATPMALGSDYRAMGWNPAHLTLSPLSASNWKSAIGGLEIGVRLSSNALDRSDLWNGIRDENLETFDWQSDKWSDWKDLLANEEIAFNADITNAASAKHWGNWGLAYASKQHFQAEILLDVQSVELLLQGGAASWFELIVTNLGDTIPNEGNLGDISLNDITNGIDVDGDAILGDILAKSRLGFSWHRSHSVGVSKAWQLEKLTLHTGASGRLLLGNGFFQLKQEDGTLDAFGAFSNGFNIPSLAVAAQPISGQSVRNWGPVGQGWGADFGVALDWNEKIWASAAITDIGFMEWRGERYRFGNLSIGNWQSPLSSAENWIDIATAALDPDTWFSSSDLEVRKIKNGATFHIGGGIKLNQLITLAADGSFDNPDLLGNSGTRLGLSFVFEPAPFVRIDGGLSKWGDETIRYPLGLVLSTGKKGFECGIQATDVQGLWRDSQPEIGLRTCLVRWIW